MEISNDQTSLHFWKYCTQKTLDLLQKQAVNRRKLLIERHQERLDAIQRLLYQREQIDALTEQNNSISDLLDSLRNDLHTKDECIQILQTKLHDRADLTRENEYLRIQFKSMEQKLERFNIEYSKKVDDHRRYESQSNEQIQSCLDEIERIKRDLVLEEYRKQEAERKVRYYDEKIKSEQNLNKKLQQDFNQMKQDLKSSHMKYDSLQIEMLAMHKANSNDISLLPTKDTNENRRNIDQDHDEQMEIKRTKRKTRDRTQSSASTVSNSSKKRHKIVAKPSKLAEKDTNDSTSKIKRKTLKSNKTTKKPLPMVKVTQASPSTNPMMPAEKDSTQLLLLPPSATADAQEASGESQPVTPRIKKPSRYPCRRAQRPAKLTDTSDQITQ